MVIYMVDYFSNFHPVMQAFIAGIFTFMITTLGSALVFLFKDLKKDVMDAMLALAAGIMLSATFFSLLNPAIENANNLFSNSWLVISIGFISGAVFLLLNNFFLNKFCSKNNSISFKRCLMLFISITLHNIPEGLVIGVAFGACYYGQSSLMSALVLTLGIALQNFPEGSAISLPLRRDGVSRTNSFIFGALSAVVEPIAAIMGAILVLKIQLLLPFIMTFTAGAMIFVVIIELIPESQKNKKEGLMALLNVIGFSIMMILELVLG